MNVLVTAGPTREYWDAVRFLSNPSTGAMGFACAAEAARLGHRVTLVTGPSALPDPVGVRVVRVTTALEMRRAVLKAYPRAGAVIATAAVTDYRPARRAPGKIKKTRSRISLPLVRNPDILEELGRRKGRRILIGFALETEDEVANARGKLRRKRLDHVVLDSPAAFGAERLDARILNADGSTEWFRNISKRDLAKVLARLLPVPGHMRRAEPRGLPRAKSRGRTATKSSGAKADAPVTEEVLIGDWVTHLAGRKERVR